MFLHPRNLFSTTARPKQQQKPHTNYNYNTKAIIDMISSFKKGGELFQGAKMAESCLFTNSNCVDGGVNE